MNLRRILLFGLAGSLTVCALFAIFVVVTGAYSVLSGRIMLTTLSVGFYSLTSLCCVPHLQADSYKRRIAYAGICASAIGLLFACLTNWIGYGEWAFAISILQFRFFFVILAIALAQICLLLLITPRNNTVKFAQSATICCAAANAALILLNTCFPAVILAQFVVPILVLSILDALGTIVTPMLHIASKA
jgi:hypothetical protein